MPDRSRIPRLISTFNVYIGNTSAHLLAGTPVTNAVRLGLTEQELSAWITLAENWAELYRLYSDRANSRTITVKSQLLGIIADLVALDRKNFVLDRIGSSVAVTIEDTGMFRIKKGALAKKTRTIPHTQIAEQANVTFLRPGGGRICARCHNSTSNRPSIPAQTDSVQLLYIVGNNAPESVEAPGLIMCLSTKAIITLDLGSANSGKYLFVYLRWYNTKHPKLSGPWSSLQTTLIV